MSNTNWSPEEDPGLGGSLGGGISGPENGVSAGVDETDRKVYDRSQAPVSDAPPSSRPDRRDTGGPDENGAE